MIGVIFVEFNQSILMKFIKIVATRCQILRLKCIKFNLGCVSATDPAGRAYSVPPDPELDLKGLRLRGGERREWMGPLYFFCGCTPMFGPHAERPLTNHAH